MRGTAEFAIVGSGQAGLLASARIRAGGPRGYALFGSVWAGALACTASRPERGRRRATSSRWRNERALRGWRTGRPSRPKANGGHITFCPERGETGSSTMAGRALKDVTFRRVGPAVAEAISWMNDLEVAGGRVGRGRRSIPDRLDAIAGSETSWCWWPPGVAPARRGSSRATPSAACTTKPQRKLAMMIVTGASQTGFRALPFLPVKFNLFRTARRGVLDAVLPPRSRAPRGVWPVSRRRRGVARWNRFDGCTTGEQAVRRGPRR